LLTSELVLVITNYQHKKINGAKRKFHQFIQKEKNKFCSNSKSIFACLFSICKHLHVTQDLLSGWSERFFGLDNEMVLLL
jgi:hypothetical protein